MRRWRRRPSAGLTFAIVLGILGIGAATSSAPSGASPAVSAAFTTPLATSTLTPDGTWATLPMGHPGNLRNTFWQLFFQPAGGAQWSNQVEATATATNGGLVLAGGGRQLTVGIRPSQNLTFTPIITTVDGGTSWTNGLLAGRALASRPNALAVNGGGQALAVVEDHQEDQVLTTTGSLSSWRTLVTLHALASTNAGRRCVPEAITAVAYLGADPLVAARCSQPGVVGLFRLSGGAWQLTGPSPSSSLARGRIEVLGMAPATSGLQVLLGSSGPRGNRLVTAWTTNAVTWSTSAGLPVPSGDHLVSYGPIGGTGQFVLMTTLSGTEQLDVLGGPTGAWRQLPSPPSTTATVADGQGNLIEALAVHDTVLRVWTLEPSQRWAPGQVVNVPIQFGSSNP